MTIIHHAHRRAIANTKSTDLVQGSWQSVAKTVAVFSKDVKMTSPTFRQWHRRYREDASPVLAETVKNGHKDRRGTQMAVISDKERTVEARKSIMRRRKAEGAAVEVGLSDRAAGEIISASPVEDTISCC